MTSQALTVATNNTDSREIVIWADRFGAVKKRVTELNRKAEKRGLAPIHISVVGEGERSRTVILDRERYDTAAKTLTLMVENTLPCLGRHAVVAVRYDDNGITMTCGTVPAAYRDNDGSHCDHCRTQRDRKRFAILRNLDSGQHLLVGSTCFKDFFGDEHAETLHSFGQHYIACINTVEEYCAGSDETVSHVLPLERFLAYTVEAVARDGYRKADDSMGSTGNDVAACFTGTFTEPSADAVATAKSVVTYFSNLDDCSGYVLSIKSMIEAGHVGPRGINIAASMVPVYQKAMGLQGNGAQALNEHFGIEKQRETLRLTLISTQHFQFGGGRVYLFRDDAGRSFKWNTSTALAGHYEMEEVDLEDGQTYTWRERYSARAGDIVTLKATIKKHGTYHPRNGDPSVATTEITRCKASTVERAGAVLTIFS